MNMVLDTQMLISSYKENQGGRIHLKPADYKLQICTRGPSERHHLVKPWRQICPDPSDEMLSVSVKCLFFLNSLCAMTGNVRADFSHLRPPIACYCMHLGGGNRMVKHQAVYSNPTLPLNNLCALVSPLRREE